MDNEQDITNLIKKAPAVQPPDDFTPRVMTAVMKTNEGIYVRAWNFLSRPREFTLHPVSAMRGGSSHDDVYLYFIMIAFAHLTLAVVLLMGLKNVEAGRFLPMILLLQPWFLLFLAGWLGFWGVILKKNAETGIKRARTAALFYIEAVVINGALLFMEFNRILLLVPLIAAMVCVTFAAGVFLAVVCGVENIGSARRPSTLTLNHE